MFGWIFRLLCNLAGVDHERLRSCPLGDRQFAVRIGLQLLFSSTFLFVIFASSLLIGFGDGWISYCVVLAMAFVTAVVVLLVDTQIVQSDFYHHGIELARDRGHEDGKSRLWAKIKRPATVSLRLLLSVIIAFAFATFFELRLFGSDIKRQIDADYRKSNAALFHDVETDYAAGLDLLTEEISRQTAELLTLGEQEAALRRRLLENAEANPEIDVMTEKLNQLFAAKRAADAEVLRRQGDAVNEKNGIKESSDHSGLKGQGSLYRNATERARLAALESERLLDEIARTQSALRELRDNRQRRTEKMNALVTAELQKLNETMTAVRSRRDEIGQKRERAVKDREARVIAIAQERPGYSAKTDGFLARVEALETLKERPAVARVTFWTTVVIMAVEVSAVLGKVFFSTPSRYAVRTALEFETAVKQLLQKDGSTTQDAEAARVRREIEIEEMRQVLVEKRATRRTKEEAIQRMYPGGNDKAA